jgi:xylulokinase
MSAAPTRLEADEGAAYGAALLAGVGAGVWPSVDEACDRVVQGAVAASPDPESIEIMNERYAQYRRIYPALQMISRDQSSPVTA